MNLVIWINRRRTVISWINDNPVHKLRRTNGIYSWHHHSNAISMPFIDSNMWKRRSPFCFHYVSSNTITYLIRRFGEYICPSNVCNFVLNIVFHSLHDSAWVIGFPYSKSYIKSALKKGYLLDFGLKKCNYTHYESIRKVILESNDRLMHRLINGTNG